MNSITQKNGKTKQTDYVLTPMLDELVRNVEFLGENVWFPSGAITILGGRKRCGKSTLALYECARFSAMGKKVLIVQREDDAGLVKAKLQCMGADLGNIMLYKRRAGGIEYCGFNAGDLRAPFSNFSFPRSHAVSSQLKPYFSTKTVSLGIR